MKSSEKIIKIKKQKTHTQKKIILKFVEKLINKKKKIAYIVISKSCRNDN